MICVSSCSLFLAVIKQPSLPLRPGNFHVQFFETANALQARASAPLPKNGSQ
jgi:hypothetical protein